MKKPAFLGRLFLFAKGDDINWKNVLNEVFEKVFTKN